MIHSCGFFRAKAKALKGMAAAVAGQHGGEVPTARAELAALPGVGPKTAGVVTVHLGGEPAFPVDTHVKRLSRRLGFTKQEDPSRIEEDLQALVPSALWGKGHQLLVWHGRRTCFARSPACERCVVRELCPAHRRGEGEGHGGEGRAAAPERGGGAPAPGRRGDAEEAPQRSGARRSHLARRSDGGAYNLPRIVTPGTLPAARGSGARDHGRRAPRCGALGRGRRSALVHRVQHRRAATDLRRAHGAGAGGARDALLRCRGRAHPARLAKRAQHAGPDPRAVPGPAAVWCSRTPREAGARCARWWIRRWAISSRCSPVGTPPLPLTFAWHRTHAGMPVDALTTAVRIHDGSGQVVGTALISKPAAGMDVLATMAVGENRGDRARRGDV